jgi:hypothetical protein
MLIGRIMAIAFLPLCILLDAQCTLPIQTAPVPTDAAASEVSPVGDAPQTEATSTRDKVGVILGNLLILSLYAFPMTYAEAWAFGDPRRAIKQPKKDSSEINTATETPTKPTRTTDEEAPDPKDSRTALSQRLPRRVQELPRAATGLAAGGCLMVGVAIVGAVAFVLYYQFRGQPEKVSEILPRFAYWFPFALLGMVADVPFRIIYWEDRRLRVLLRLVIWWFPRIIIIAFAINPPFLQDLDLAITALAVLAIDGVFAAFCLGLYAAREQMRILAIR